VWETLGASSDAGVVVAPGWARGAQAASTSAIVMIARAARTARLGGTGQRRGCVMGVA
jgi:hypothetical protein